MKLNKVFALMSLVVAVAGCSQAIPEPGHVSVLVEHPYLFGSGGVDPNPVTSGREYVALSTDVKDVDITPQTVHVAFNDYSSADNILLDFDTAIQYEVTDPVVLVKSFGSNWFTNNVQSQYASIVREAVKTQTMTDMMSNPTAATMLDEVVTSKIRQLVKDNKIPIRIMDVTLGRAVPNQQVLEQMNETAAQQQRLRTLDAAKIAEDARKAQQESKAVADQAYQNKMGMSVEDTVRIQIAQIQADACKSAQQCVILPPGTNTTVQTH